MLRYVTVVAFVFILFCEVNAQAVTKDKTQFHTQSFGLQAGLSLLENPFVLYPVVNLSWSKTILGRNRHQVALLPQLGAIALPGIETKFLLSNSLQYKYISKKRVEASVFLGINYQLRKLAYDRYQFEDNSLKNKGPFLHQFGPITGVSVGYKIIKKPTYSITPFLGISLIKLNKDYQPDFFAGYKPNFTFGLTFNN